MTNKYKSKGTSSILKGYDRDVVVFFCPNDILVICQVKKQMIKGASNTTETENSMTPLSKYERETVVNYNVEEQTAIIYTRDKALVRKRDRLVIDFPDIYKLIGLTDIDKTYSMPKSYISYRKPKKTSDE